MTELDRAQSRPSGSPTRLASVSLGLALAGWLFYLGQACLDLTLGLLLAILTAGGSALCSGVLDALPVLLWLGALVSGHLALRRKGGPPAAGRRAVWGLVLSYSGLFVGILALAGLAGLVALGLRSPLLQTLLPSGR